MRVLITGAAGGIGSVLSDRLYKLGHELVLVDDLSGGNLENFESREIQAQVVVADLVSNPLPKEALSCDVIVHLAAISSLAQCQIDPQKAFAVNVGVTAMVAEVARQSGAHLIFASTSAVYENNKTLPFAEEHEVKPELTYSQTKWLAEKYLEREVNLLGLDVTVLRFFNVFGPRQDVSRQNPPLVNYLVREAVLGRTPKIYAPDNQGRDYVHVDDVVTLIELCIEKRPSKYTLYNVCSGSTVSMATILSSVARGLGVADLQVHRGTPSELWEMHTKLFDGHYPLPLSRVEAETLKTSIGDPEKTFRELGWRTSISVPLAVELDTPQIVSKVKSQFQVIDEEM
jgi:UDP-glucose 4-epimerase